MISGLWRLAGKLTDQQRSLIEERLKYTDKELSKKGLRAGFRSDYVSAAVAAAAAASMAQQQQEEEYEQEVAASGVGAAVRSASPSMRYASPGDAAAAAPALVASVANLQNSIPNFSASGG